tara:strand:+ start:9918 stop:10244 length:327 start_codon:yes stop_codon:yes gene_type:complete
MSEFVAVNKRFDIIKCSKELKKVILERVNKLNISMYMLCEELNINYDRVKRYMNCKDPLDYNVKITQQEILMVCDALKIDIRVTISIQPEENVKVKSFDTNHKFKYKK